MFNGKMMSQIAVHWGGGEGVLEPTSSPGHWHHITNEYVITSHLSPAVWRHAIVWQASARDLTKGLLRAPTKRASTHGDLSRSSRASASAASAPNALVRSNTAPVAGAERERVAKNSRACVIS